MSKYLKALERIRAISVSKNVDNEILKDSASTIEKALKVLDYFEDSIDFQFWEKKERNITRYFIRLVNAHTPSQYFEWELLKEEYDLLKEVLL